MKKRSMSAASGVLWAVFVACGVSDQPLRRPAGGLVEFGARTEWTLALAPKEAKGRAAAAQAWRQGPDEGAALRLAGAYYPEFRPDEAPTRPGQTGAATGLSVLLPGRAGAPIEISARGYLFRVTRLEGGGRRPLWAAAGPAQREGGRVLAQRFEEYDVVEGAAEHRAAYRLELPRGIEGLRDTGEYLEFSDGEGGPPVLRMHYPQVRDASGRARTGFVRLRGASAVEGQPGRFTAAGALEATCVVDLAGLEGPLVVDPGWSSTATMAGIRNWHTSTLLSSGKVLVAGGSASSNYLSSSALYDPGTNTWTVVASTLAVGRYWHTATRLPSGKVLLTGGIGAAGSLGSTELFDPVSSIWSATPLAMATRRLMHTATLLSSGMVLVVGGQAPSGAALATVELFDPGAGTWTTPAATMTTGRVGHTATLLPSGRVLVTAGADASGYLTWADVYDPATGTWAAAATATAMAGGRSRPTATLLPTGKVLLAGGINGMTILASTELFDPGADTWAATATAMTAARSAQTATLLPSGKVLVAGGSASSSVELFDPAAGTWAAGAPPAIARKEHSATLLADGKVLLAGGSSSSVVTNSSELYDPATGLWTAVAAAMNVARSQHAATLLPSGKVLVAGGYASGYLNSAEVYDPTAGTWTATATTMTVARQRPTATLLASGKVLVVGGWGSTGGHNSAELYDPATGGWTAVTNLMSTVRSNHTATLLPSGKVLVVAGATTVALKTAELFDPVAGTWAATGSLANVRYNHTATLLPSGKVLVTGGYSTGSGDPVSTAELYDPATGTWTATAAPMTGVRTLHTATLLATGKVLVAGGLGTSGALGTAELFEDTGASDAWRPTVLSPGSLLPGASAVVTGTLFRGLSGASGGRTDDSATDFPRVSLQSIDNQTLVSLPLTGFGATAATVSVPATLPPGRYLLWVAANAVYGGKPVRVGTNVAPTAAAKTLSTLEDTALPVTLTGLDGDGDPVSFAVVNAPAPDPATEFFT